MVECQTNRWMKGWMKDNTNGWMSDRPMVGWMVTWVTRLFFHQETGHQQHVRHGTFLDMSLPHIHDASAMLRLALPANGDLDRDGLPLISRLTVLSAIHCSTGFTLDASEVYVSDMNQRHVPSSEAVVEGSVLGGKDCCLEVGVKGRLSGGANGEVGG